MLNGQCMTDEELVRKFQKCISGMRKVGLCYGT